MYKVVFVRRCSVVVDAAPAGGSPAFFWEERRGERLGPLNVVLTSSIHVPGTLLPGCWETVMTLYPESYHSVCRGTQ